jgi:hypothetical protein
MKRWMTTVAWMACVGVAAAQTPAPKGPAKAAPAPAMDKAAIEKALIANEMKVNDAVVKGDLAAFKAVVADDAWSIDEGMGMSPVSEFEKMLKPGVAKVTGIKLDEFKVVWVDADTAILTYTWTGKGTMMDQPVKSPTFAASVYAKRGGKWVAVFHQETPKAAAPAPAKK